MTRTASALAAAAVPARADGGSWGSGALLARMREGRVFTPCSTRHGRHCSPAHAESVRAYRAARHAHEVAREAATLGYAEETRDYHCDHGTYTFRTHIAR